MIKDLNGSFKFGKFFANLSVFALVFAGLFVLFGAYWIKRNFEVSDFGQILFHLRFPLLGNGVPMITSFCVGVILPSVFIAFFVAWGRLVVGFWCEKILPKIRSLAVYAFITKRSLIFKCVFALAIFALCVNMTVNKLRIKDYLRTQMQFSQLYEKHYKPFDMSLLTNFTPKQNLIVIFVESLESNLAYETGGGGGGRTPLVA